jgi:hypothetical protein
MIFVGKVAFGQNKHYILNTKNNHSINTNPFIYFSKENKLSCILPENYQYTRLGFFCKYEWKLEKYSSLPIKFRLGSIDYCNWLEGKNNKYQYK